MMALRNCLKARNIKNTLNLIYTNKQMVNNFNTFSNVSSLKNMNSIVGMRNFNNSSVHRVKDIVTVTYRKADGERITVDGREGDDLLDIANNNNVDLEGFGACEGTLSCSTCHLIFKKEDFDKIPEPATDEELDMLDLAYGLSDTSRLGCQVCITKELDGIEVDVPEVTADARTV